MRLKTRARAGPVKILLMFACFASGAQGSAKLPARRPKCDASCQAFRKVMASREDLFRPMRGEQMEEKRWKARLIVPSFETGVCAVAEMPAPVPGMQQWGTYYCKLPQTDHAGANREFESILPSLKAALPKGWHTELLENQDEGTPIFRAGPTTNVLYVLLGSTSDDRGYVLTFQASSMPIPTD